MVREFRRYLRIENKDTTRHPRGLVLFQLDDNTISAGYSLSAKVDHFDRKVGYNLAKRRIESGRYTQPLSSDGLVALSEKIPDKLRPVYWDFVQHKVAPK